MVDWKTKQATLYDKAYYSKEGKKVLQDYSSFFFLANIHVWNQEENADSAQFSSLNRINYY